MNVTLTVSLQDSLSPEGALDVNAIMIFIEWNKEAVQRYVMFTRSVA